MNDALAENRELEVAFRVADETGKPVHGASIRVVGPRGSEAIETDAEGTAVSKLRWVGTYTSVIESLPPGYVRLRVAPGGSVTAVRPSVFTLDADGSDVPRQDYVVSQGGSLILCSRPTLEERPHVWFALQTATAGLVDVTPREVRWESGKLHAEGLLPGAYVVCADFGGFGAGLKTVQVDPGYAASEVFDVTAGAASLALRIEPPPGTALPLVLTLESLSADGGVMVRRKQVATSLLEVVWPGLPSGTYVLTARIPGGPSARWGCCIVLGAGRNERVVHAPSGSYEAAETVWPGIVESGASKARGRPGLMFLFLRTAPESGARCEWGPVCIEGQSVPLVPGAHVATSWFNVLSRLGRDGIYGQQTCLVRSDRVRISLEQWWE